MELLQEFELSPSAAVATILSHAWRNFDAILNRLVGREGVAVPWVAG